MSDEAGSKKMSHQRKMTLKSLMLNKAKEDLEREAAQKAEEKKTVLGKRLKALEGLETLTIQESQDLCRELHQKIDKVMDEGYDLRVRVKKNDKEIDDLNQQIFDLRGKFKRPPLRRVRMSADQMLRALLGSKHKVSMDLRSNLKAVKKTEEKKDVSKNLFVKFCPQHFEISFNLYFFRLKLKIGEIILMPKQVWKERWQCLKEHNLIKLFSNISCL